MKAFKSNGPWFDSMFNIHKFIFEVFNSRSGFLGQNFRIIFLIGYFFTKAGGKASKKRCTSLVAVIGRRPVPQGAMCQDNRSGFRCYFNQTWYVCVSSWWFRLQFMATWQNFSCSIIISKLIYDPYRIGFENPSGKLLGNRCVYM